MLPEFLYFSPIRRIIASTILSDVESTEHITRHQGSDEPSVEFSECDCTHIFFQPESLTRGVNQRKIFPKVIHLDDFFAFQLTYETFPEVLYKALKVNGNFLGYDSLDPESDLEDSAKYKVRFDSLTLQSCEHVSELPTVVTSLELIDTTLDNYIIDGLKKLTLELNRDEDTTTVYFLLIFTRFNNHRLRNN